ncbi:MAG TPA: endonuclease NucS domain-containing protein, partial [Longimicrobiaceae bacterium]|nr:endonuclease NucS domain-containing protein [Longimicrobiaceae bacterium]
MLFRIDTTTKSAAAVRNESFADLKVLERHDIQEWVLNNPELLGEELFVVTTEFDSFDRTSERLDVLALDSQGRLVVVELKRTAAGTAAELQAIRYAAYCSTLALSDVAELHAEYLRKRHGVERSAEEAERALLEFVTDPAFEELDDKPRIILAAEEFPQEITATILWLRSFEVDISAVRLRPYSLDGTLLVDSTVLIPLPEAEEFLVRRERKDVTRTTRSRIKGEAYRAFFQALIDEMREKHDYTSARAGQPQAWYLFASGVAGVKYGGSFPRQGLRA